MRLEGTFTNGAVELVGSNNGPFSSVMQACYPYLLSDLSLLLNMLQDLRKELSGVAATARRHGYTLAKIEAAEKAISELRGSSLTRDHLVAQLRSVLRKLGGVGDDLVSSPDTVAEHGFKLQHVDLTAQLLSSTIVAAALEADFDPLTMARLQNLRACCKQALSGNAAPMVAFNA
ncbi:hypothetical protein G7077_02700 [Sphingomonas piscis]|uniref:Uncharacterized protein n=1 Tax=Sphingomonas piscis TaxID=2714943 RepID=A0A6G7YMM0_9SPHN|nr:hypothetical protein [Sphingomonas piscis]QIK77982.1 hypothetical protein G7077_02700 [Sphingomonas piscis]